MSEEALKSCLNLTRRMPPSRIEANLGALIGLKPELDDELLSRVDQPLKVATCAESGRKYLLCDYNRDGDSYRSPWSNKYEPALEEEGEGEGVAPTGAVRKLEVDANEVFDAYRELYFGAAGSVSSVYCWDNEGAPAACWCVKKEIPEGGRYVNGGSWDTVHVFEVKEAAGGAGGKSSYRLTSTVMLSMRVAKAEVGQCDLSGHLTRKDARELLVTADGVQTHVTNMGKMVEEMETALRDSLDNLYISKTAEALAAVRTYNADSPVASSAFVADLTSAIGAHALKKATKSGAGAE